MLIKMSRWSIKMHWRRRVKLAYYYSIPMRPYCLGNAGRELKFLAASRGIPCRISIASAASYMARRWLPVALDGHRQLRIVFEGH